MKVPLDAVHELKVRYLRSKNQQSEAYTDLTFRRHNILEVLDVIIRKLEISSKPNTFFKSSKHCILSPEWILPMQQIKTARYKHQEFVKSAIYKPQIYVIYAQTNVQTSRFSEWPILEIQMMHQQPSLSKENTHINRYDKEKTHNRDDYQK